MKRMHLILALLLFTASCSLFKQQGSTQPQTDKRPTTGTPDRKPPVKDTIKVEVKPDPVEDSLNRIFPVLVKDKYTVAVFLPLYLKNEERDRKYRTPVKVAQEFYKGLLIAADTLASCGMNLELHVYDSENKFASAWSFKDTLNRIDADLIIGPLLNGKMDFIDSLARVQKRNRVSPLQSKDDCRPQPYYLESMPSGERIGEEAARIVKQYYPRYKPILINDYQTIDNPMARAFAASFGKGDSLLVVNFDGKSSAVHKPEIAYGDSAIIFIPSKNEVFVSGLKSQIRLDSLGMEKVLIGTMPWLFFKSLEGSLWERMHVHLLCPYHIDYDEGSANGFIRNYRARYGEEPSIWAFIGFDELVYYGKMMQAYGRYFQRHIDKHRTPMLHTTYEMRKDSCGGYENRYVNILHFKDYELKKLEK